MGICTMIQEIKKEVENSKGFKYWHEQVGITIDDFRIIDIASNSVVHKGNKQIGDYCIIILDDGTFTVSYDTTVITDRLNTLS